MARLPRLSGERQRLLSDAMSALSESELLEQRIEEQVSMKPSSERHRVPGPPRLIMRSATAMVLSADPWKQLKGDDRVVAGYSLFCKNEGSGVAVSLNNVDFKGTGIPRPQGDKILVHGLKPNESYVFAVAPVDLQGKVIEGVGETSVPVVALLPMPTLLLWGHVALTSKQLQLSAISRMAGQKLYTHFVDEGVKRAVWEQNPVDRDMLRSNQLQRAPRPLLRVFAQILITLSDIIEEETLNGEQQDTWQVCDLTPPLSVNVLDRNSPGRYLRVWGTELQGATCLACLCHLCLSLFLCLALWYDSTTRMTAAQDHVHSRISYDS